ncbi:hypothetical protein [Pseudoalteromonas fuliginea]|uniref:hypothetical protein n=1 Tax=Pseudoalteromonas fuliginea TaxID=1872678 RepID=UPI00165EA967|nr:hypothetical protein [Pseudoalteromonas fuliginea]
MKIKIKKKKLKELNKTHPVKLERDQLVHINGGDSHHGTSSWLPGTTPPGTRPSEINQ